MPAVTCPLCGQRKARRACPALGRQICAVCCGTKRQVAISCPADCVYLASAREHPPAALLRQKQRDVSMLMAAMQDFNDRQAQLFLALITLIARYRGPELHPLIDDDVREAVSALAGTYDTAARGVIYEFRPQSLPAERLVTALKPLLAEAGKGGGSVFEREAANALRKIEELIRLAHEADPENARALLDLLVRAVREGRPQDEGGQQSPEPSRLIVP
jgi:hypothetical protein